MRSIEITIPVLNEELTLERQIRKCRAYVDDHLAQYGRVAICISDNGSSDGTAEIAERLRGELPDLRVVTVGERGVGRALKASWRSSTAEIVGYMDLDFSTDLKHLDEAFAALADGVDVVNGSRLAAGARVRGRSLRRAITSRAFNMLLRTYLRTSVTDGMCGFKFMTAEAAVEAMANGAISDGWFFATEVLVAAESSGLRIHEIPVQWTDDPDSRVKIGKLSREYLREMRSLKRRLKASSA